MKNPRIAIVHEHFLYNGGGERLIATLGRHLNAEIFTGFIAPEVIFLENYPAKIHQLFQKWPRTAGLRHLRTLLAFARLRQKLQNFDVIITSGNGYYAIFAKNPGQKFVHYCHFPPRFVFDLYADHAGRFSRFSPLRFAYFLMTRLIALFYRLAMRRHDHITTNSENIRQKLKKYTGITADAVVFPPVDLKKFK